MINPIQNPVVLAMIFTVVGFIAGALIAAFVFGRGGGGEKEDNKNPEKAVLPAPPKAHSGVPVLPPEPYQELARLWWNKNTGRINLRIDDKVHINAESFSLTQRERLKEAVFDLLTWFKPANPIPSPTAEETPVPVQVKPGIQPPPSKSATDAKKEKKAPATMVEQVEEILQEMLNLQGEGAPNVHLTQDARGGVVVWVGSQHFDGVDQVPDKAVQTLIRQAVSAWEKRVERGQV